MWGKRFFDVALGLLLFLLFLPLMCLIAIGVVFSMGRPILFTQSRVGLRGRIFRIMKFRTMSDQRDVRGRLAPDSLRVTSLGSFLRRWSLDELPTFIHVIRGEMSLVGPRPLIREMQPARESSRTSVLPGITGLVQVSGGNRLSLETRHRLDEKYMEEISFCSDIRILLQTPLAILLQKNEVETMSDSVSA